MTVTRFRTLTGSEYEFDDEALTLARLTIGGGSKPLANGESIKVSSLGPNRVEVGFKAVFWFVKDGDMKARITSAVQEKEVVR